LAYRLRREGVPTGRQGAAIRALFFTHDLDNANSHLMPWRTVCEVTSRLGGLGIDANLVSLSSARREIVGPGVPPGTVAIRKKRSLLAGDLREVADNFRPDAVFWPLAWREPAWRLHLAGSFCERLVGYFPGGVYQLGPVLRANRRLGARTLAPYLLEALAPKGRRLGAFRRSGVRDIIALSDHTARTVAGAGWPEDRVHTIYPGRDAASPGGEPPQLPAEVTEWLDGRPYYLFMGPPSAIRGVFELIAAFDRAAALRPEIALVCLFRADAPLEAARIRGRLARMRHGSRVLAHWESLERGALAAFLANCHALVLPFRIVPSEIPLAVIEALAWETPVIASDLGGTGEFVRRFGIATPPGNVGALARAMVRLAADSALHEERRAQAQAVLASHPTWQKVAEAWAEVACRATAK